ncbi:hypothetical protein RND71_029068 [Anisodus tanguticus]|uniref:Glucose-methanol-choline oxidoreductase C-terminal domain-containing protein n=1 Tax=Anisodus tanguticus TaxID=243964 RepID=A0AAE1RDT4_9SOLA|nr:hypothetical protein RND71_029068 [Anisodus tanguticus]
MKFVFNATEFPSEDYYDYIVVGGGTAGCPLAATLSEKYKILLLERGGVPYGRPSLMTQEGFLTSLTDIDDFESPAQAFTSEDGVPNARGRILGGSSAINAGFYSRADQDFILVEAGIDPFNGFSLDHVIGIKIAVYASVERILLAPNSAYSLSKQAAIGVIFRDQSGRYHHAMPYLSTWGIVVAHHLPYVGKFLFDNPRNGISIVPPMPPEHSLIQVVGITNSGAYLEAASNVIPFASPANSVFIRTSPSPVYLTVATLMEKIVGPVSSGLRLASTDVRLNPIVQFNYFSNTGDVERCVNGTRKIADVLRTRTMEIFKFDQWFGGRDFRYVGPALPVDESNDELMREFCHQTVNTIWHYHGGCVVGKVVDQNLRVLGIEGLRVVDGSIFTVSPRTNPQATLLMLGRYVGMVMLREKFR